MAKARTAAEAEAAILLAARVAFSATGFAGTPVAQIAKEAGVSTGLIYHYFKDKETLWRAVGDAAVQHFLAANESHERSQTDTDPWTRFVNSIRFTMQYALNHPASLRLRIWDALGAFPHYPAKAIETFLHETVSNLQTIGIVRSDLSAFELVNYMSVSLRGWAQCQVERFSHLNSNDTLEKGDEKWLELMLASLRKV